MKDRTKKILKATGAALTGIIIGYFISAKVYRIGLRNGAIRGFEGVLAQVDKHLPDMKLSETLENWLKENPDKLILPLKEGYYLIVNAKI